MRSIIISIDHRAAGFHDTNNIVCLKREEIDKLDAMLNSTIRTEIVLKQENIDRWKAQFITGRE